MHFLSAAFVVTLGLASVQPNSEVITNIVNEPGKTQQDFFNFFESLGKNDPKQKETYRSILEGETRREQQAFDSMKNEWRSARFQSGKQKLSHAALKREAKKTSAKMPDAQPVVEDVDSITHMTIAVSLFAAAKSRYQQIKRSGETTTHHENEPPALRAKVCQIFAMSPFAFDNYNIIPYKKNVSSSETDDCPDKVSSEVTSVYEQREVTVEELGAKFQEYVYVCPAWNYEQEKIENFYISSEHGAERQRFAFQERGPKELVAVAIVERIPEVPAFINISQIDELKVRLSALLEPSHAICNLSAAARERLCTILSSSKEVRYPLPKSMRKSDKEPQCTKQTINYYPWRFNIKFEEWALECNVIAMTETGTTYGTPFVFYLTMGVDPGEIFLCRIPIQYENKILIFDHCFLEMDLS